MLKNGRHHLRSELGIAFLAAATAVTSAIVRYRQPTPGALD
jgi:hypothetical protein